MKSEESQRKLQELLSAARGALEEALEHARKYDLWFEFTGLRRVLGEDLNTMDVNDPHEVTKTISDLKEWGNEVPKTCVDILDLARKWVGSWY